ncbi:alpha/beta hydrolase [Rhizobium ruizarguesonis]|uniref:alpha/beta hydrolase n=1 Tax=Rhizobium ruizarguesonis TaxID=2081791 RepID=UPI001953C1BE|nr:alpha/beta hydrolase [Rhizobium ruizarguesonis]
MERLAADTYADGGNGRLRDEAEAYARKLDAAGVDVVVTRYNGMIHDFGAINPLSDLPASRAAMHQASEELKARLR